MAVSEYNKVSFITSHSKNIPTILKQTGGLIVVSDLNDKDTTSKSYRMSLWLHGNCIASGWGFNSKEEFYDAKWWQKSYNSILGETNPDGSNFFLAPDGIEDSYNYSYNDDGILVAAPYSIRNRLDYVTTYASEKIGAMQSNFEERIGTVESEVNDIKTKDLPKLKEEYTYLYQDSVRIAHTYYDGAISYSYAWIRALIGDCPETLDSLQEIKQWLDNEMANNIETLKTVKNLNNNAFTHDGAAESGEQGALPYDENSVKTADDCDVKFAYLSEYCTVTEFDDRESHDGTCSYYTYTLTESREGIDENGYSYIYWVDTFNTYQSTYTYSQAYTTKVAKNAVHDTQVSSEYFGNHTVDYLLRHIIKPYEYKEPSLEFTYCNGKHYDEWVNELCEYGTTPTFEGEYDENFNGLCGDVINNDDNETAIHSRRLTLLPLEDDTTSKFNEYVTSYGDSVTDNDSFEDTTCPNIQTSIESLIIPNITDIESKEDLLKHVNDLVVFSNQVKISHGDATLRPYPLLTDDENLKSKELQFTAGQTVVDLVKPLEKHYGFCIYYNELTSDEVIPSDETSVIQNTNKVFITETGVKDIEVTNKNNTTSKVWLAVPSLLIDDDFVMFTKSYNSGITQPITDSMSSDILFKHTNKDVFKHANLDYSIITLENVEFAFAEKIFINLYW